MPLPGVLTSQQWGACRQHDTHTRICQHRDGDCFEGMPSMAYHKLLIDLHAQQQPGHGTPHLSPCCCSGAGARR
jgi:hypothetical protein